MIRIPISKLHSLLWYSYTDGLLYWKVRGKEVIPDNRIRKTWNTRFSKKEALGSVNKKGYKTGRIFGKTYLSHRVIWAMHHGEWPENIDHINHSRSDNRIENLRNVTHQENSKNQTMQSNNKSGVIGVCWCNTTSKWMSQITADGGNKFLGHFNCITAAAVARKQAEIKYGYHENHGK